jgi:hypothetical protein
MSYIILRRRWCDITVWNVHSPTEDKISDMDSFYEELEHVFDKLHKFYMKISMQKLVGKTFLMRVYMNLVMGRPRNKA